MKKALLSIVLISGMGLTGCVSAPIAGLVSTASNSGLGPMKRLAGHSTESKDQKRTKTEATAAGTLVGAALGRYLLGSEDAGMLIGAAIGGGVGAVIGNKIAKIKKSNIAAQDKLDQQIALLNAGINQTRQQISHSQAYRKVLYSRIAKAGNDFEAQKVLKADFEKKLKLKRKALRKQKSELKEHKDLLASAKRQAKKQKSKINSKNSENKISSLQREINIMEAEVNRLAQMKTRFRARG